MTRAEHLAWAKQRALAYLDQNELGNAMWSMVSDLGKHEKLCDHLGLEMGAQLLKAGLMNKREMRQWIEGFN